MNKKLLGLAITAALSGAMNAQAFINFDTNGTAAGGVIQTDVFDWAPGNVLFQSLIQPGLGTTPFELYGHGSLSSFLLNGSFNAAAPAGSEFTYTFHIPMLGSFTPTSTWDLNALSGGVFEIFYGAAANNNTITGGGFADGRLILQGSFNPDLAIAGDNGTVKVVTSSATKPLDGFGADNKPGVTSKIINGNMNFTIDATYADSDFFLTDVVNSLIAFDLDLSSQLTAPFTQVNPSSIVGGVAGELSVFNPLSTLGATGGSVGPYNITPNYDGAGPLGVNDTSCPGGFPCDIHVQSDASSTFQATAAPEPATLALIGVSLLGFGASRRRKV